MLAQNFKSHTDLGLTEPQFDALRKTLVLLETGKLVHVPMPPDYKYGSETFTGHFNMGGWRREAGCGSICCIGGTAELVGNTKFYVTGISNDLHNLFYPKDFNKRFEYEEITPTQAATALRSFLTTGDAHWDLAVAS